MRTTTVLRITGKLLITAGLLILLFVAYQLWGTGLQEAASQRELRSQFDDALAQAATTTTTTATTVPGASTTEPADPVESTVTVPQAPLSGDAVARIEIPSIGVDKVVVDDVTVDKLREGPGHYPDTPLPGQAGNAAIAGHRTTYGAPFNRIDELEPGDQIDVTTLQGQFAYGVRDVFVVQPEDVWVLDPSPTPQLTLTACHPKYSASERIVVVADLLPGVTPAPTTTTSSIPPVTTSIPGDPTTGAGSTSAGSSGQGAVADGEAAADVGLGLGLGANDPDAWLPAVMWALAAASVAAWTYLLAQRSRRLGVRLLAYAAATPVVLVLLFPCFAAVDRLLPAGI